MPDYGLKKEQPTQTSQSRPSAELTPEQITKSISEILFQRMSESEVELMKAENAELKLTLENFTKNYMKFEDLTNGLIHQNSGELLKLINELHNRQEQKLNSLKTSNEEVNRNVEGAVKTMTDKITTDISSVYAKMQKDTAQSLIKYTDKISELEKKTKQSWTFTGVKEALFWCMCIGVLILNLRAAFNVYEIHLPDLIWGILYPGSFMPLIIHIIRDLLKKNN